MARAIVIGYSFAGKLAARVLADVFQEVVVFEKDSKPTKPEPRKGIPQSHHPHVLLKRGEALLESLFPNFVDDLLKSGSVEFDFIKDIYWVHHGRLKTREGDGFRQLSQSRPLLEWVLQTRLEDYPNIKVEYETKVEALVWSDKENRVNGVLENEKADDATSVIEAELIVDATGAAALFEQAFKQKGIPLPKKEEIEIGLSYTSQRIKWQGDEKRHFQAHILYPDPPRSERGGILYPLENREWMATLISYGRDPAPTDPDGFKEFARSLAEPHLYEILTESEFLSNARTYSFPMQLRRRLDQLKFLPPGLIVMGDAWCRFDPVFGQGMTAASLQAYELKMMMQLFPSEIGSSSFVKRLYKRFFKRLSPLWLMVISEDFSYSGTKGKRPLGLSLLQTYMAGIYALTEHDPSVYQQFSRVLHLLDSPFTLFKPPILMKWIKNKIRN